MMECSYGVGRLLNYLLLVIVLFTLSSAVDARRSLRIEGIGVWPEISTEECFDATTPEQNIVDPKHLPSGLDLPGVVLSTQIDSNGSFFGISCYISIQYDAEAAAQPGGFSYFNADDAQFNDEYLVHGDGGFFSKFTTGIKALIGANIDNAAKGVRIEYVSFDEQFVETGFEWQLFTLPNNITLVRLRGPAIQSFTALPLTNATSIKVDGEIVFSGDMWPNYFGEFFCFEGNQFRGVWDEVTFIGKNPLPGCSLDNIGKNQPIPLMGLIGKQRSAASITAVTSLLLNDQCDQYQGIFVGGDPIVGDWSSADKISATRFGFADYYHLHLEAQKTVQITLVAANSGAPIDTYLFVREECDPGGRVEDFNDDFGGSFNSRVTKTLPAGSYLIEATTFLGGVTGGPYVIDVVEVPN